MALTVTPTSGDGPYTLSIEVARKDVVDGVYFALEARSSMAASVCPVATGAPNPNITNSLIMQGFYIWPNNVPAGSCRVFKVDIVNVDTSEVVSTQSVSIDNI